MCQSKICYTTQRSNLIENTNQTKGMRVKLYLRNGLLQVKIWVGNPIIRFIKNHRQLHPQKQMNQTNLKMLGSMHICCVCPICDYTLYKQLQ